MAEPLSRLYVKEQTREQGERDQEEEQELPQERESVMSMSGNHQGINNGGL